MRVKEQKEKGNAKEIMKKILKWLKVGLFLTMLILIFMVSPRITQVIQDTANYIYNLESDIITRVVQLILTVSLVFIVTVQFKNKK